MLCVNVTVICTLLPGRFLAHSSHIIILYYLFTSYALTIPPLSRSVSALHAILSSLIISPATLTIVIDYQHVRLAVVQTSSCFFLFFLFLRRINCQERDFLIIYPMCFILSSFNANKIRNETSKEKRQNNILIASGRVINTWA